MVAKFVSFIVFFFIMNYCFYVNEGGKKVVVQK